MYLTKLILKQVSNKIPLLMNEDYYTFKFLVFLYSPIMIIPNFPQLKCGKTKMAREVKVTRNFCGVP